MCDKVKATLEQATETPVYCEVTMDGNKHGSEDFVCVMARENGDASIFYNTDALTLGMAVKMVSKAFVDAMHQLPEEERNEVSEILGGAFIGFKEGEPDA